MTESAELDRRTVLGALGTSAVVAGLAGCSEDSSEGDNESDDNASTENGGGDMNGEDDQDTDGEDGEDIDGGDGSDMDNGDGQNADGEDGMAESDATVQLSETAFEPVLVEIDPGQTVAWVNEGDAAHDVTASQFTDAAVEWSLSVAPPPGEAVSHTFEEAGVYEYVCTIHGGSASCGAVIVGDPKPVRLLPCMGVEQIQQHSDTLDLLAPERPYSVEMYNGTTGTSRGEQNAQVSLREGPQETSKMTYRIQTQQEEGTIESYFDGDTTYVNDADGQCFSIPSGVNHYETITQEDDGQTGENTRPVNALEIDLVTAYERMVQRQTALEPVDTTTIDGTRAIVFDIDLQAYRERDGESQNIDIREAKVYVRTDSWHLVRQEMEYTTDQGQVSLDIEYSSFGEPVQLSNPC